MKKHHITTLLAVAVFSTLVSISSAQVTLIQENFDNYGSSASSLATLNGGSGFSAAWTQLGTGAYGYNPVNLTATNTGYVNNGNAAGGNDGSASNNGYAGGLGGNNSYRDITQPTLVTGDTVWMSFTMNLGSVTTQDNISFSPFGNTGGDIFNTNKFTLGVSNGQFATYRLPGGNSLGAQLVASTTYLIVARLTIDAAADANDTLDVWFNPGNVTNLTSLGAASQSFNDVNFSGLGSSGAFLAGTSVAIRTGAGAGTNNVDALRIAFGGASADNFASIMAGAAIPEPSSYAALAGLASLALVGLRRRRAAR